MIPVEKKPTSRLWLVTVDCIAAKGPTVRVKVLVAASGSAGADAVAEGALEAAEVRAPMGPKWVEFQTRETQSITLPWIITEMKWSK